MTMQQGRVTTRRLARDLALRLQIGEEDAERLLAAVCSTLRDYLQSGHEVELGNLLSLTVQGGPEIREDESGGFSAYAAKSRAVSAMAIGDLKSDLEKSCQQAIYYVARGEGHFTGLLSEHFGRRGWDLVHLRSGMEVQTRLERQPAVALIFESNTEGWRELLRELKCNPATNWVPAVGIFPKGSEDEPVATLTVQPDETIYEPFDFSSFIQTAGSELASRVTMPQHDVTELALSLPGSARARREAKEMIEEILYRCGLPETFNQEAGSALAEALDNAMRHGHRMVDCCTIGLRMILDPKRLVLAVRDSGDGFDYATVLAAARSRRKAKVSDPLAKAAEALRTRHGAGKDGGIARMLEAVDRVDFNKQGNEVVLTKNRP